MKKISSTLAAILIVGSASMNAESLSSAMKVWTVAPETGTTIAASALADGKPKKKAKAKAAKPVTETEIEKQIRELREEQAKQQAEIEALKKENADKDAQLAAAKSAAASAEAAAQVATQQSQTVTTTVDANAADVKTLKSNVSDLQTTSTGLAATISANKVELSEKIESPSTIHYKGLTITPVLWVAGEVVIRSHTTNSDISTPLNSIPFPNANEYPLTENNFTARQSRIGGLFEGKAEGYKLSGYFESDFLGTGVTSNDNQSNSYVFRVRQIWGKVENKTGTAMTGGQTWSLVTENRKGTDVRTEIQPNTIDPNYMVGYSWERQPGYRVQQTFTKDAKTAVTLAASVEQAQTLSVSATNAPANFVYQGQGTTGGLYNSVGSGAGAQLYSPNLAPDVIFKAAGDIPHVHVELGGLARFFRERIYPAISAPATGLVGITGALPYNNTVLGGGAFGSVRYYNKFVELAAQAMVGDGTGRYGSSQLPDVTVHTNGVFEPIRNYHGTFSLETHPAKKLDVYAYYGGEYAQRTVYATGVAATPFTGYGPINVSDTGCFAVDAYSSPGSTSTSGACGSPTRYIWEFVGGATYKAINSPRYGQLQYRATFSYISRSLWAGVTSGTYGSPTATYGTSTTTEPMVHLSMRYYIP
jgi:hypothetical protein